MNQHKPKDDPEPTGYLKSRVMTEILPRADKELAIIREKAIEEDPVLQKAAMNINLRAGEFLLKSKLNPKSSAGETVGLKKTDLVEIE